MCIIFKIYSPIRVIECEEMIMAKQEKTKAELYREERKKRLAKAAKKNSKKSITSQSAKVAGRIITVILVLAILAAVGFVVVRQTGIIERSKTAFTIDGEPISEAEYEFYYMSNFNNYYQYAQYGYISLSTSEAPSSQPYDGALGQIEGFPEDQTPMWSDFFEYSAKQQLKYIKSCIATAKEEGIELTDEDYKAIDSNIDDFAEHAKESNYSASAYLKANYGKGMNTKLYRSILEDQQLATALQNAKTDEYKGKLTNKEINEEYKNNLTTYGKISLLSFNIPAEQVETTVESENEGEEPTTSSAPTEETLAKAAAEAEEVAKAETAAEFNSLARKIIKEDASASGSSVQTSTDSSYEDIQSVCSDEGFLAWASDTKTQAGETYVYNDGTSGSTAFFMVESIHKAPDSEVYDSRHILIKFVEDEADEVAEDAEEAIEDSEEVVDSEDAEPTTEEAKEEINVDALDLSKYDDLEFTVDNKVDGESAKNKEAYKKIQDILEEYLKGEHTEDAFADLATKYTEDTGSSETGGLYEDTKVGDFVPPYEEWCLADGRKAGDVGIVEYEGDNYKGYHLIYFIDKHNTTWKDTVKESLASAKFNEYSEELVKNAPEIENVNDKVCAEVVAFLDKIIKNNARNAAAQAG